jgi:hypothetical protein
LKHNEGTDMTFMFDKQDKKDRYSTTEMTTDGVDTIGIRLWRGGEIIAEIDVDEWCALEAVKEWGGERDEEQPARDAAASAKAKESLKAKALWHEE